MDDISTRLDLLTTAVAAIFEAVRFVPGVPDHTRFPGGNDQQKMFVEQMKAADAALQQLRG